MWKLWQLRRTYRRASSGLNDIFAQTFGRRAPDRDGFHPRPAPPRKKKKIDPSVGEYVSFEEIKDTSAAAHTDSAGDTSVKTESQIEDAVWEEIR